VSLGTRPGEAESLVGPELAEDAVASGTEGDGQDEADGEQLDGDLLEGTDALGDGVGCMGFAGVSRAVRVLFSFLQGGGYEPECSSFCGIVSIGISLFSCFVAVRTLAGDLILGEDWRRRPLTGCWARKTGAARCLSMLKARVDCIVCVCVCVRRCEAEE
jgi:hypothetical protein